MQLYISFETMVICMYVRYKYTFIYISKHDNKCIGATKTILIVVDAKFVYLHA